LPEETSAGRGTESLVTLSISSFNIFEALSISFFGQSKTNSS
jgi:hypothetical protein